MCHVKTANQTTDLMLNYFWDRTFLCGKIDHFKRPKFYFIWLFNVGFYLLHGGVTCRTSMFCMKTLNCRILQDWLHNLHVALGAASSVDFGRPEAYIANFQFLWNSLWNRVSLDLCISFQTIFPPLFPLSVYCKISEKIAITLHLIIFQNAEYEEL